MRALLDSFVEPAECGVVVTETGVDHSKPVGIFVHELAGIGSQCRVYEVKHACYGATGALKLAAAWVAAGVWPGKKALVVASDFSRAHLGDQIEPLCGGCGVAMLVRIGAVQAMAAPAPIRLSILRLEMPSVASLVTGSTRSPPPQIQKVPGSAQRRNVRLARARAHDAAAVSSFHRGARFSYGSALLP